MAEIRKMVSIELHRRIANPRFTLALLLNVCIVMISFPDLTGFLSEKQMQIQAVELFGFLISDRFAQWLLTFSFLIMVGDAPFVQEGIDVVLIRTDKKKWLIAQSLVMVLLIVIWLAALEISILLLMAGHISWGNEWSSCIRMAARMNTNTSMIGIGIGTSMLPLTQAGPFVVFGVAFLYAVLLFTYFGAWGIAANLLTGRGYGPCIVACFLSLRFLLINLLYIPQLERISPVNIVDLTANSIEVSQILYTVSFFGIQILILIWVASRILRKRDVYKLR